MAVASSGGRPPAALSTRPGPTRRSTPLPAPDAGPDTPVITSPTPAPTNARPATARSRPDEARSATAVRRAASGGTLDARTAGTSPAPTVTAIPATSDTSTILAR